MNVIFFEENRSQFFPFAFTRPIAEFRIGILTIREKWEKMMSCTTSFETADYLSKKFPLDFGKENSSVWINSSFLPNLELVNEVLALQINESLEFEKEIIAVHLQNPKKIKDLDVNSLKRKKTNSNPIFIKHITDIFSKNEFAIKADYEYLTKGKISQKISDTNTVIGNDLFVEEGAKIEACVLNSTTGPIYIGKNSEIMEGTVIRGPFALCENSILKLSTKIYGATTVGPNSRVGGEVNNSVIFGYSNKGHDGFLGNSVIGEWCNLGADTNNSNLKNNYAEVKLWNYGSETMEKTGLQFCGLFMGDHSKCGINTMFNTGTVVGVFANIFGGGFPPNFIPSFSWGGSEGFETYQLNKAFEVAHQVMDRRHVEFTEFDQEIISNVYKITSKYRD
ncbi:MAG: GlmU family protein [Flavobacteriales bacterium]|nr:GlmU family protein [Flavobacteriales bacterium]